MDTKQMTDAIQEIREWKAATEPKIERLEGKIDDHSNRIGALAITISKVEGALDGLTEAVKAVPVTLRWWITLAVAAAGALAKWL